MKLMTLPIFISLIGLMVTNATMADELGYSNGLVRFDCYDGDLENEGTENKISVAYMRGGKELGRDTDVPSCDALTDSNYRIKSTQDENADEIIIQTSGDDALWMDEVYYKVEKELMDNRNMVQAGLNASKAGSIQSWGIDGGNGYCLSTDPKDNKSFKGRNWRGVCSTALSFNVKTGKVSVVAPLPPVNNYELSVDCFSHGIDDADTKNTITASFYVGAEEYSVEKLDHECNWRKDSKVKGYTYGPATHIIVRTNGNDGFWMDELFLKEKDKQIQHWGREDGKGYCLSTDPGDAQVWKGRVDGCHNEFKFDVKTGGAFTTKN